MTDAIDKDILISRIIDGEATAEDWSALRALAAKDPSVWADLASMQQDCAEVHRACEQALRVACNVEAPILELARHRFAERLRLVGAWGGWAAAAAVLIAWAIGLPDGRDAPARQTQGASLVPDLTRQRVIDGLSPDEAFAAYLRSGAENGRVLGLDPSMTVVRTQPLEGGSGYEVLYIRQILERAEVDLYRLAQDEAGRPVRIPLQRIPRGPDEF